MIVGSILLTGFIALVAQLPTQAVPQQSPCEQALVGHGDISVLPALAGLIIPPATVA